MTRRVTTFAEVIGDLGIVLGLLASGRVQMAHSGLVSLRRALLAQVSAPERSERLELALQARERRALAGERELNP